MRYKGTHLTYCLNIHPGETWDENFSAIRTLTVQVKEHVCPHEPFGLGLRLSAAAAGQLLPHTSEFRRWLDDAGMYAFTINGFPYGRFHGARVKEHVYEPDWTTPERRAYTGDLAAVLAALLPEGVTGSISTVPVGYGKDIPPEAVENLLKTAGDLARIEDESGRTAVLALEPEPDCALQRSGDVVDFWETLRRRDDSGGKNLRFLGICVDTCHCACEFERPAEVIRVLRGADIPIPKIQLSCALAADGTGPSLERLRAYAEDVYLHQTRVRSDGEIHRFADLPEALEERRDGEWRVHFHVPLHHAESAGLSTTAHLLDDDFFSEAIEPGRHLEIETYSFDVLPGKKANVIDSIVSEFEIIPWNLS